MPPNNFVLIDYENIQPKNIEILRNHPLKVFIFVGENQVRIPFETVNTINSLFTNKLDETELSNMIKTLQAKKYISLNQENVSYHLPKNL